MKYDMQYIVILVVSVVVFSIIAGTIYFVAPELGLPFAIAFLLMLAFTLLGGWDMLDEHADDMCRKRPCARPGCRNECQSAGLISSYRYCEKHMNDLVNAEYDREIKNKVKA